MPAPAQEQPVRLMRLIILLMRATFQMKAK
jgi:hypothetical protein